MIITCTKWGQLGNQLNTLASQIASVKMHNIKGGVLYTNFSYLELFPNLKKVREAKVYNSPYYSWGLKFVLRLISVLFFNRQPFSYYKQPLGDDGKEVNRLLDNKAFEGYNVIESYPYYDYSGLCKFHEYIKWCFEPELEIREEARSRINDLKKNKKVVIGVHIRRKDYKLWRNGEYYFEDNVYYMASQEALKVLNIEENDVVFVICSDEEVELSNYNSNYVGTYGNSLIQDLALLSECDYLIATQSSFSGWASYIGKIPTFRIRPKKKIPEKKSDFMIQFFQTDGAGLRRKNAYEVIEK